MAKGAFLSTETERERAFLVGVEWRGSTWPVDRSLDELERLASTAGADCFGRITQRLDRPIPRSFIGSGKIEELKGFVERLDIQVVIFDDDLSPSQQSHLEKKLGPAVKVIDRTALILDIFGLHARTKEGRLQVQLAQLQYLLPRLRGMWSHLCKEQTRGGIGSRFGQGESQLEIDRRLIRDKISSLRRQLKELQKRREVQSKDRSESLAYRVALAGYTNAGKSSLLNLLTGSEVLAQDKLFATLDPTTRSYELPGGRAITITDTVGFIQKLPHGLVEAFKSTLSEVLEADLILKVVDISDDDWNRQLEAVESVLAEIGATNKPALTVFNKIDALSNDLREDLAPRDSSAIYISAKTGQGLNALIESLSRNASSNDDLLSVLIPFSQGRLLSIAHECGHIIEERYEDDGVMMTLCLPKRLSSRFTPYHI